MIPHFVSFLSGAVAMAYALAAIYFTRFWIRSHDTLFLSFAATFFLLALNQTLVGLSDGPEEQRPEFYILRLVGFVMIIFAIARKNMGHR